MAKYRLSTLQKQILSHMYSDPHIYIESSGTSGYSYWVLKDEIFKNYYCESRDPKSFESSLSRSIRNLKEKGIIKLHEDNVKGKRYKYIIPTERGLKLIDKSIYKYFYEKPSIWINE